MRIVSPLFCTELVIDSGAPFTLVIENRTLFRHFIEDLRRQVGGESGKLVLSEDNRPLRVKDNIDLIDGFAPFDINTKAVLSGIADEIAKKAVDAGHYLRTSELMSELYGYIDELCFELPFSVECRKLDVKSIVKAAAVSVVDDYVDPLEKIIDYMSIRRDIDGIKLFVTVNMSSYFETDGLDMFMKTAACKDFGLLMIESFDRKLAEGMKKLVIDADLCEF